MKTTDNLVLVTLNGLPDEYSTFETTICARSEPISRAELSSLSSLICSEVSHVESAHKSHPTTDLNVAYTVARG